MQDDEIISFLKSTIEPLADFDGSPIYRCSGYLKDGLRLPCISFRSAKSRVELALRRFKETLADAARPKWLGRKRFGFGMQYPDIVKTFTTSGNQVNSYEIKSIEPSPFAIPLSA